MKRIFCSKCDNPIPLSTDKVERALQQTDGRLRVICPNCHRQLNLKLRTKQDIERNQKSEIVAVITIVENVFGYKQIFPIQVGRNGIGRRNKDTKTDIAILTSDPSIDRHHCYIDAHIKDNGQKQFYLTDNDSMTGTFLLGREISKKEKALICNGDTITIGATSIIFSTEVPTELLTDSNIVIKDSHK